MFIVLDESVEQALFQLIGAHRGRGARPMVELDAVLRSEEDVITLGFQGQESPYLPHSPGQTIPSFGTSLAPDLDPSRPAGDGASSDGYLLLLVIPQDGEGPIRAVLYNPGSLDAVACGVDVVRLETDVFSRLKGIFDTRILASKVVCIIGVGSGGGIGALELAKSGVGGLILVDFDRLRAHNIARHVCGLADVGRFKTRAVKDLIQQHNPMASVQCHQVDITEDDELLHQVVADSDLVFVATDSELSRHLVNEACLAAGKPAVYGGAYERAFAGEVIRVIPGAAGCYACVRQNMAGTMRSISTQQVFDYTDDSEFQAEPGLGLDVSFIAMIHTKVALMTLLRGTESSLGDIDAEMVLWTNTARPEDGELFERPLTGYFVRVAKSEQCPACGEFSDLPPDEDEALP